MTRIQRASVAGFVILCLTVFGVYSGHLRAIVEGVDRQWGGESFKDFVGRIYWDEDWSSVSQLPTQMNYDWLQQAGAPIRIAHALGAPGRPGQNSLAAAKEALGRGFRLLEVDISLDAEGNLLCHHGPEAPPSVTESTCTLERLLAIAAPSGAYVVLDIKTDFSRTAKAIFARVGPAHLRILVFQLYLPAHIELFNSWIHSYPLPGPIITAYLAHRSLNHVAMATEKSTVRVLTVPLQRLPALTVAVPKLLVHPISSCDMLAELMEARAELAGGYLPSDPRCQLLGSGR